MRWLALLLLASCATAVRPAEPGRRAHATVQELRRHDQETRWIVTVNNPTAEDVIIDCDEARIRIAAHTQQDVLLMPDDVGCDLKNATEYRGLPVMVGHKWGRGPRWRVGP